MSVKFWKKNQKKVRESGTCLGFEDLMSMLHNWIGILGEKGTTNKRPAVRVCATEVSANEAPPAKKPRGPDSPIAIGSFPATKPPTRCNVCNDAHATQSCPNLIKQDIEGKMKILSEKRLCFHCFGPNHSAKFCRDRPQCGCCGRVHATILHDRIHLPSKASVGPRATESQTHAKNTASANDVSQAKSGESQKATQNI